MQAALQLPALSEVVVLPLEADLHQVAVLVGVHLQALALAAVPLRAAAQVAETAAEARAAVEAYQTTLFKKK